LIPAKESAIITAVCHTIGFCVVKGTPMDEIRISNTEIRNKHEIQNPKLKASSRAVSRFGFWSFGFVSGFILRISDFFRAPQYHSAATVSFVYAKVNKEEQ
jgi:hypothetical protein